MPEHPALPSLHWERAVRAEIDQSLAERRIDDALAAAESLLRQAFPRQLDVFRKYGALCLTTGRFERGFQVLWKAAESIEGISPWYGAEAWLALAELAPPDVRLLRRAAQAGHRPPLPMAASTRNGLRIGHARLVAAGLLDEAAALQAEVDFPLAGVPPEHQEASRREPPAPPAAPAPRSAADQRFDDAALPETWRAIARDLTNAGEPAGAAYANARAEHLQVHPGCLSGPAGDDPAIAVPARVLLFPDRQVGAFHVRTWESDEPWSRAADARGQVVVGAGSEVRLSLEDESPDFLAILDRLGPDDVQALELLFKPVDDAALARISRLTGLRLLSIVGADMACSGALSDLTLIVGVRVDELRRQFLGFGPTDDGLRHVAALSKLRELDISVAGVGDRGLGWLRSLEHLEVLHLHGSSVTDVGLQTLAQCRGLRAIDLSRTRVTLEGLMALAELPRLEILGLSGVDLAPAPPGSFSAFPALRVLQAASSGLPVSALWGCRRLESLDLSGHTVARQTTFVSLAQVPSLRTVYLSRMQGEPEAAIVALTEAAGGRLRVIRDEGDRSFEPRTA